MKNICRGNPVILDMKTQVALIVFMLFTARGFAEPLVLSWYSGQAGAYARIYQNEADRDAQQTSLTWSDESNQVIQAQPTYAGVHEVQFDNDWVYIRTSGMGFHIMGPWDMRGRPGNTATLYRFPRTPVIPTLKQQTGGGAIGYYVDGVALFDARDAFSYSSTLGRDAQPQNGGDGFWNRDAFVNEFRTFDAALAHQANSRYHYHANTPALRHILGDHVSYDPASNTYSENPVNLTHSPILGWVRDGHPIYGPYGYSDPLDPESGVRRMISGFQLRDGSNGSTDLRVTGRTSHPAWAARLYRLRGNGTDTTLLAGEYGPAVDAGDYILGNYIEDHAYKGDLGMTLGVEFDKDEHNGRFCVTPEFPQGVYAYFLSIQPDGTSEFPYSVARAYYGDPVGDTVTSVPTNAVLVYEGGPEAEDQGTLISSGNTNGGVVLEWNLVEGAEEYRVECSTNLIDWVQVQGMYVTNRNIITVTEPATAGEPVRYYRSVRLGPLAPFDDEGFVHNEPVGTNSPPDNVVTFQFLFDTNPQLPATNNILSITVGGVEATIDRYRRNLGEVTLIFDSSSLVPGSYMAVIDYTVAGGATSNRVSTNSYVIDPPADGDNILLLILDDWGVDASPADNFLPGAELARMPNLMTLASNGVRFTRAYANPVCSPTRATLLTGRYPHQTGIYAPAGAASLSAGEITLPEAFTAAGTPHVLGTMGKWHLGGDNSAYQTLGGWDEFYGINGGGVGDYFSWSKNSNGSVQNGFSTYSTRDQVDEAIGFIDRSENDGRPWLCWVAFNAPHSPFHNPAATDPSLEPPGGYSVPSSNTDTASNYIRMLETLDDQMGRLLANVDPLNTHIILVGDNGTPGQVVQAPYGDGRQKDRLYEGGIHVPMIIQSPHVSNPGTTSDKLVHVVDLYSTILEMAEIDPATVASPDALAQSQSVLPILSGSDTVDRFINAESLEGRSLILDDYPDYKLIVFGDPVVTNDFPRYEFYHLATDTNEMNALDMGNLSAEAQLAFDACMAKDTALGGGFSDRPSGYQLLYIELPDAPNLTRGNGSAIEVTSLTVDGVAGIAAGRFDAGVDISNEFDDVTNRYWVKAFVPQAASYTSAHVVFPDTPGGDPREYDSIQILVAP